MNYLDYYELAQEPFSNAPVSRFYFNSPQHSQALVRLTHLCSQMKGLGILVGDIGAGKTTLARRLLDSLPENEYDAALLVIIHSGVTAQWLLKRIALQLGVDAPSEDKLTLLGQLYLRLVRIYEAGKKAVVLIDEAQMLATRELMEEFRGLLNLEVPERKLLNLIFFGLPDIEQNLKLDPPLAQRVALKYRLDHLNADSTEAYIKHRLRLAGAARMPFTPGAVQSVHRLRRQQPLRLRRGHHRGGDGRQGRGLALLGGAGAGKADHRGAAGGGSWRTHRARCRPRLRAGQGAAPLAEGPVGEAGGRLPPAEACPRSGGTFASLGRPVPARPPRPLRIRPGQGAQGQCGSACPGDAPRHSQGCARRQRAGDAALGQCLHPRRIPRAA